MKKSERTHLMLSPEMKAKALKKAEQKGVSLSEVIRLALAEYLDKKGK